MFLHLLAVDPNIETYIHLYEIFEKHPSSRFLNSSRYYSGYNFVVVAEENLEELFWEADILCKVIDF